MHTKVKIVVGALIVLLVWSSVGVAAPQANSTAADSSSAASGASTLEDDVAALETWAFDANARLAALEETAADAEDVEDWAFDANARLAALEAASGIGPGGPAAGVEAALEALNATVNGLDARLDALELRVAALEGAGGDGGGSGACTALAAPTNDAPAVSSGDDLFLAVEGIEGESTDRDHAKEIDVLSWSWGVAHLSCGTAGGGGGVGRAVPSDFVFTHPVDKSSPVLFLKSATGEHIPEATLTVRKSGETAHEYLKITLKDVVVTSVAPGTGDGSGPVERVTLSYGAVRMEYVPQKADGSAGTPVVAEYDFRTASLA